MPVLATKQRARPAGSSYPIACPITRRYSGTQAKSISDCLPCPAGHYCEETGLTNYTGNCLGGYYCPEGQSSSGPAQYYCDRGYYCPGCPRWGGRGSHKHRT